MTDAAALLVVRAGALTTVQDGGRPGYAHLGVPRSGALDPPALAEANRLVGNHPAAAGLETTLSGVALRALEPCRVAVTGAAAPVTVDGWAVPMGAPLDLPRGALLEVGAARSGVRSYVAVAGAVAVDAVLGSRATDILSGLGPPPLRDGGTVPVGIVGSPPSVSGTGTDPLVPRRQSGAGSVLVITVRPGPRHDWFGPRALAELCDHEYEVSSLSNRIALRLQGRPLERVVHAELPSEGLVLGAVQVPADGQPLVFLADHPTTGGYPVVAVVEPGQVWRCGQARPGSGVRFRLAGPVIAAGYGAAR